MAFPYLEKMIEYVAPGLEHVGKTQVALVPGLPQPCKTNREVRYKAILEFP